MEYYWAFITLFCILGTGKEACSPPGEKGANMAEIMKYLKGTKDPKLALANLTNPNTWTKSNFVDSSTRVPFKRDDYEKFIVEYYKFVPSNYCRY